MPEPAARVPMREWLLQQARDGSGEPLAQSSDCTPASSWRAITIRWTWLVPS